MPDSKIPPIGFKEWTFVCEALGQGVQTLILRKGGIHEGRGGFHFQHDAFWLFPTGFHNQGEQLKWTPPNASEIAVPQDEERETVKISYHAVLHGVWRVTDWEKVEALEPLHIWKEEVIKERFAWNEESCLHVALVRVSALPTPWVFPYERGYGGCRSWVKLPSPERVEGMQSPEHVEGMPEQGSGLEINAAPVMDDTTWNQTANRVRQVLGS